MSSVLRLQTAVLVALTILAGIVLPTFAGVGEKRGWSLRVDPRKRAFLTFVPEDNGPLLLRLGCLRDADLFNVMSEQNLGAEVDQTLTLQNGTAQYVIQGKFEPNGAGVGQPGFASEVDADANALRQIRAKLLPVLEGEGPIVLTVGPQSHVLPVAGLGKPLDGFKSICFGKR